MVWRYKFENKNRTFRLFKQEYYTRGYGVKDLASNDPVNENTRFLLASVSKHISGVAVATVLADQDRDESVKIIKT